MNKKLLLMYGLFLGWGEILINQIFSEQTIDLLKVAIIFVPLSIIIFLIYRFSNKTIEQFRILENTSLCIGLMIIYYTLYQVIPVSGKYLLVIILLLSLGFMTLMMFVSFKYYSEDILALADGIKIAAFLFFMNTSVTLIYKIVAFYKVNILDGIILFLILCAYYWYFFNDKSYTKHKNNTQEAVIPKRLLLLLGIIMLLLSVGYGPFLNSMRTKVVNQYTYAFIYIRLAYILGIGITYRFIALQKKYLEVIMMFFTAIIVITHLVSNYITGSEVILVVTLVVQVSYAIIHCSLGGLVVMTGYLYGDSYKNMLIILLTAFFAMILGTLLPGVLIGNATLNVLTTLICSVLAMAFIMFMKEQILDEFDLAIEVLKCQREKMRQVEETDLYSSLTPREKEVMSYLVLNYKNKDIAEKLEISENTLKKHAKSIYTKMEVKNKKELKMLMDR